MTAARNDGGCADPDGPPDWSEVAAPGTDPDRLAAVVARAVADRRGFEVTWREASGDGDDAAAALAAVLARPVLPTAEADHVRRTWRGVGAVVALAGDPTVPARLVRHDVVPPWWVATGAAGEHDGPAVAIVGSRKSTGYGTGMAAWLAEAAADAGVHVVSGGAVGIDAAAHRASHDRPAGTTVVLGCGHGVAYPRPHARPDGLFDRVRAAGGRIVSESLPDDQARPYRVRSRNRLIAALADAVVVVEGGARSGSLITATWAGDLGLPVLAVPGDARAPGSAAPHLLLRDGAAVCAGPADLLAAVGDRFEPIDPDGDGHVHQVGLPGWLQEPLATAWPRPLAVQDLVVTTGRDAGPVLAAVTRAQVAGVLTRDVDGVRLCRRPTGGGAGGAS